MLEKAKIVLKKYYGYSEFREEQVQVIENILKGDDTLAIMPTGSGKSICYQVPALLFPGITIVISPLISLMKDQVDALKEIGIPSAYINSTLEDIEISEIIFGAKNGDYKIIYISPERLESEYFCNSFKSIWISQVAIDEAHCVSKWGHDFRTSYRQIGIFINSLIMRPIVSAFTATATEEVREDILKLLSLNNPKVFIKGFDRENLKLNVVIGENKKSFIDKYLKANRDKSGIIYAATRKDVDSIYDFILEKGYDVVKYHAGLLDSERALAQEEFLKDNKPIMVATNAFGMGIDKSNVRYVIHYSMPKDIESYYQEIGRAGRDGEDSECMLLFSPQDVLLQKYMIEQSTYFVDRKDIEYAKLQQMVDYCYSSGCFRKYILKYFGEKDVKETCGNCSNCLGSELKEFTIETQKILSCIFRMKESYGITLVAEVLKGYNNKKIVELDFDKLSTHGIMKEYKLEDIKKIINMLIAEEYVYLTNAQYPVARLGKKATSVLKNGEKVFLRLTLSEENKKVYEEKIDDNKRLFEELRLLRKEIADRENIPPYIVFSDATLKEMSLYRPMNKEAMLNIKGVGEHKFSKYGFEFIEKILTFIKVNELKQTMTIQDEGKEKEEEASHVITLRLFREGLNLKDIAAKRDLKEQTVLEHIIKNALDGEDIEWDRIIDKEEEQLINEAIDRIGASKLKPIKEMLPENIDYNAIKLVICKRSLLTL